MVFIADKVNNLIRDANVFVGYDRYIRLSSAIIIYEASFHISDKP